MSGLVTGLVLKHSQSIGNTRLVLIVIADAASDDGSNSWPSMAKIAARARVSERTAQRCIQELVAMGELAVEQNTGGPAKTPDNYRPNVYSVLKVREWARGDKDDTPKNGSGVTNSAIRGVTCVTPRGDTAVSPSYTSCVRPKDTSIPESFDPFSKCLTTVGGSTRRGKIETFEPFWTRYPRKENKPGAYKAWCRLNPADQASAIARLLVLNQRGWDGREEKFIPHPASWLNGRRWEDELGSANGYVAPAQHIPTAAERREGYRNGISH